MGVETQLRKNETPDTKTSVRYAGVDDVCWRMYVGNEAYGKLGEPDAIRVTIEAMRLDDIQYGSTSVPTPFIRYNVA